MDTETWAYEVNIYTEYVSLNNYGKNINIRKYILVVNMLMGRTPNLTIGES